MAPRLTLVRGVPPVQLGSDFLTQHMVLVSILLENSVHPLSGSPSFGSSWPHLSEGWCFGGKVAKRASTKPLSSFFANSSNCFNSVARLSSTAFLLFFHSESSLVWAALCRSLNSCVASLYQSASYMFLPIIPAKFITSVRISLALVLWMPSV